MKKICSEISNASLFITAFALMVLTACQSEPRLLSTPSYDEEGRINAIIVDTIPPMDGHEAVIAQVGSTCEYIDPEKNCVGVQIVLVGNDMGLQSVVAAKAVGTLIIEEDGRSKTLVVGIPFDKMKRTLDPRHFMEFFVDHEGVKRAIEAWFLARHGPDAQLLGWDNEEYATGHIERNLYVKK